MSRLRRAPRGAGRGRRAPGPAVRLGVGLALIAALLPAAGGCARGAAPTAVEGSETAAVAAPSTAPSLGADPTAAAALAAVRDRLLSAGACDVACLDELRALWAAHPGDPGLRVTLTNALIQRRDWSGIEAVIGSVADPSDADRLLLAKALVQLGRFDEAAEILAPLVAARPEDPDLAYNAAFADYYGNRHDQAAAVLDRAWDALVAARDDNARTLRAMIHLDAGETERAAELAASVVSEAPDFFPAWDVLGRARAAAGDIAGATEAFDRVDAIHAANAADTARKLRLAAQATALQAAWRARDVAAAERLVDAMLPEADAALQRQLYEYAVAIYEATGRPDEADAARAAAARLPLAEDAP